MTRAEYLAERAVPRLVAEPPKTQPWWPNILAVPRGVVVQDSQGDLLLRTAEERLDGHQFSWVQVRNSRFVPGILLWYTPFVNETLRLSYVYHCTEEEWWAR